MLSACGISKRELARRMNVSAPYITKMLSGDENFTLETLLKAAEALHCELVLPDFRPGPEAISKAIQSRAKQPQCRKSNRPSTARSTGEFVPSEVTGGNAA